MRKIAWITDSTSCIDSALAKEQDIHVVPLGISFGEETFRDGIDLTNEQFFDRLRTDSQLPKSSQPAVGDFVELYKKLKGEYEFGIAIHISGELSGTANASKQAAEIAGFPLEVIDSKSLSLPLYELIKRGQKMNEENFFPAVICETLRAAVEKNQLYVIVGSLEQLRRSGRVNPLQFMVGNMLKISPILTCTEGRLEKLMNARSHKKALDKMLDILEVEYTSGNRIKRVYVLHANANEDVAYLEESIQSISEDIEIFIGEIGAVIGVHAGEGTVGISWFDEN